MRVFWKMDLSCVFAVCFKRKITGKKNCQFLTALVTVLVLVCFTSVITPMFLLNSISSYAADDYVAVEPAAMNRAEVRSIVPLYYELKTIYVPMKVWGYRLNPGRTGFVNGACPVNNCVITSNASYVDDENFDAFLIHLPTMNSSWKLRQRKPHQMFVLYSYEPPRVNGMPKNIGDYDGYFNRTMTYLSSSDFPYPYGAIEPLASAPRTELQRSMMMSKLRESSYNPAEKKTKLAVWMVMNNWEVPSNRQKYVQALQKYMTVEIISETGLYGGKNLCPKSQTENMFGCLDMIETDYKFFLAFENSICQEYVTEKFFVLMARNIVPVVLGGANYSAIAPPHSYINALDYSPKQLAQYLLELDRNDTLYKEYFWWKPFYRYIRDN